MDTLTLKWLDALQISSNELLDQQPTATTGVAEADITVKRWEAEVIST